MRGRVGWKRERGKGVRVGCEREGVSLGCEKERERWESVGHERVGCERGKVGCESGVREKGSGV